MSGWDRTRWWRVVRDVPNPGTEDLWCESSSEDECREALRKAPYPARLERFWQRVEGQWRPA
jgi:hypothetical protein